MNDITVKVADNATNISFAQLFALVKKETGKTLFTITTRPNAGWLVTYTKGKYGMIENKIVTIKR